MMNDRLWARREALVLFILAALFLAALLPALRASRQERRDGLRREHLTQLKRTLEHVNNDLGHYPPPPDEPRTRCSSSLDTRDWFFGTDRRREIRKHLPDIPRDPRLPQTWDYRYCVTATDASGATAWVLRTRLERRQEPRAAFDPEEGHNYYSRVLREGPETLFEICGGTLTCGVPPPAPD